MKHVWIVAVLLALTGLGCQTRLIGEKLPPVVDCPAKLNGIPFYLTKPMFKITKTAAGRYTLGVEHHTDTSQRYTLNVDPAEMSEYDLELTMGEKGQLTLAVSDIKGQGAEFITAIGTFAAKAVTSAAGLSAMFDQTQRSQSPIAAAVIALLETNPFHPEMEKTGTKIGYVNPLNGAEVTSIQYAGLAPDTRSALDAAKAGLIRRLEQVGSDRILKGSFYAATTAERGWLLTARSRQVEVLGRMPLEGDLRRYRNDSDAALQAASEVQDDALKKRVQQYVVRLVKAGGTEWLEQKLTRRQRTSETAVVTDALVAQKRAEFGELAKKALAFELPSITAAAKALVASERAVWESAPVRERRAVLLMLDHLLSLNEDEWRWRRAADLQDRIHHLELVALQGQHPDLRSEEEKKESPKPDTMHDLQVAYHAAIDAAEEFTQLRMLQDFLRREPVRTDGAAVRGPEFDDYEIAREQLATVKEVITAKHAALRPKPKVKAPTPQTPVPSPMPGSKPPAAGIYWATVLQYYGSPEGNITAGWVDREINQRKSSGELFEKPDFVVVMKREVYK